MFAKESWSGWNAIGKWPFKNSLSEIRLGQWKSRDAQAESSKAPGRIVFVQIELILFMSSWEIQSDSRSPFRGQKQSAQAPGKS